MPQSRLRTPKSASQGDQSTLLWHFPDGKNFEELVQFKKLFWGDFREYGAGHERVVFGVGIAAVEQLTTNR